MGERGDKDFAGSGRRESRKRKGVRGEKGGMEGWMGEVERKEGREGWDRRE